MFPFPPPTVIALETFTRLPDRFRAKQRTVWAEANVGGREVDSFLEGPVFDTAGNLYVTDIPFGRVFRITPQGDWDLVAQWEGEPNGMKFLDPHTLLITDYQLGLVRLDTRSGARAPHLPRRNTESFKGLNDLTLDSTGNVYFTDQGQTGLHDPTGRVYRLRPSGQLDLLLANVPSPNGVVLSPDGKVLYVAATRGNCVWRAPLQADGSVSKVGQFFTSSGPSGPDGLAMDEAGQLYVANPGLGLVWALDAQGQPVTVLQGPRGHSLTNLAFGGEGRKTVFVTDSSTGEILCARVGAAGVVIPTDVLEATRSTPFA
jgi:gluconolactonase